ncbi:unnamed protein product [Urochloa humidicola]
MVLAFLLGFLLGALLLAALEAAAALLLVRRRCVCAGCRRTARRTPVTLREAGECHASACCGCPCFPFNSIRCFIRM